MAGLLAARVLADHFDQVTIIERDRLPDTPVARKGLPQARHVHLLLARGRDILERLFPGLQADLLAHGARYVDVIADVRWLGLTGWAVHFPSGITTPACPRDLLDWAIRQRLAAYPQVRFLEEAEVTELVGNAGNTQVTGVHISRRQANAEDEIVPADLVVDASGRNSKAPQWLQALGYRAPAETVIRAFIGYASRIYARPPGVPWEGLLMQPVPPTQLRGGAVFPLDSQRWIVTLSGAGGDYPPTDEDGFLAFARSLRDPLLYETLKDARPLSAISGNRSTENRLRHYERLARWPGGLVVLGDAACALNPIYGQGMTAAALAALTLDRCLRQYPRPRSASTRELSRRFQRELARVNHPIWLLATGEDFRYPQAVGGRRTLWMTLIHHYIDQIIRQAPHNRLLYQRMVEVIHLLRSPMALASPAILMGILKRPTGEP
jgi:2-polyprenyl-6-methoxyphenol hydroxylase-like FAD-dependent oxidoreductase